MTQANPSRSDLANKYCRSTDLSNEASVESFFVLRMLADLGYEDHEIRTKQSVDEVSVSRGGRTRREAYKPDYLINGGDRPRWIIDAKSTSENIEDFTYQGAGYAMGINRRFDDNPVRFYMLTNGLLTRVYRWDRGDAVLSLRFTDFTDGNTRYRALHQLLGASTVRRGWEQPVLAAPGRALLRPTIDEIKRAFLKCHRIIWKAEKLSPQAAFLEFAKLLFVKLWEDRRLRDDPQLLALISQGEPIRRDSVRFSLRWVEEQEANDPNPVASILFRQLVESLEREIADRKRKRIFQPNERLDLAPGTVKRVVALLEGYYLFGIDEDLNGRMFEAFLTATMRGQALGQYFTPRSVVKLMTRLARPVAQLGRVERVLDACCGTGGFLIEALTDMRAQVYSNTSLTKTERQQLLEEIANEAIFGIDAGREPPITRIARINMYLHGDGGSRIYLTDGLRHIPQPSGADPMEVAREVEELRSLLDAGERFDVVLSNPPFSMGYSADDPDENEILESYELTTYAGRRRKSLRSSVMFIEQYWRLLRPGGRLLTVIDDSVLSGSTYAFVRAFIRERFIIRAVISIHGDAFQRSGARAKTSILYLTKRTCRDEYQPSIFAYESLYVGRDDVVPRTPPSVAELARQSAVDEMEEILGIFEKYRKGEDGDWLVSPEALSDRLDAKYIRPWSVKELSPHWAALGVEAVPLSTLVEPIEDSVAVDPDTHYEFLRITYEGRAEPGETRLGREISYSKIGRAQVGDIVVSNISAVYRAICVMPDDLSHLLVSNEFTVLRPRPGVEVDAYYIWSVLRTAGVVAEWLSGASGVGRHRVDWGVLQNQQVPLYPYHRQKEIGDLYRDIHAREQETRRLAEAADASLADLNLEGEVAKDRLARAKPPK